MLRIELPCDPAVLSWVSTPQKLNTFIHKDMGTPGFKAALFTGPRRGHSLRPPIGDRVRMGRARTMGCHSATRKTECCHV